MDKTILVCLIEGVSEGNAAKLARPSRYREFMTGETLAEFLRTLRVRAHL